MGDQCCYPGCKNGHKKVRKNKNVAINSNKLFKFPAKDPERFEIWKKYTGKTHLTADMKLFLCDVHFDKKYFHPTKLSFGLNKDAVPTVDFVPSEQKITVLTPNKGEHLMDITPKVTKLSFREEISGMTPDLAEEIKNYTKESFKDLKFESSAESLEFIKEYIADSEWGHTRKSESLHRFAFFPSDSENDQSVISFILDTSIDIKQIGQKSNISVQSINGPIEMKTFKAFFIKRYIPQCRREIIDFMEYIEDNWEEIIEFEKILLIK